MRAGLPGIVALLAISASAGAQVTYQRRMGEPLAGLSPADLQLFEAGKAAFTGAIDPAQGRGPIFNEESCGACHSQPDPGGASTTTVVRFGKKASGSTPFDPLANLGGSLLQVQSNSSPCAEHVPPEADVIAHRLTPHTFGSGLVETIDDADIIALSLNPPPGTSGLLHWIQPLEGGAQHLGRFGWKNQVATVKSFSADASKNELGFTNALVPTENAPNGDPVLLAMCDSVADPEDVPDAQGLALFERMTHFQRLLAPPPQTPRSGMTGAGLFESVGCSACHTSAPFVTGTAPEPALSHVSIQPYSDFLLHDMGSLGDGIVQGTGTEREMATRALWGMSLRTALLHDGRATGGTFADNVSAAIGFHDGEGAAARDAFAALLQPQRDQLIAFLGSLGQAEFDFERDHDVDEFDWFFLEPGITGPGSAFSPDDPRALADIEQDGDFDLRDFLVLQEAFTGGSGAGTPLPPPGTQANVSARSGGQTLVQVAPGAQVPFEILFELLGQPSDGLAGFAFDLHYDGGALAPLAAPSSAPFNQFASPLGLSNPAGYGGTSSSGDLLQVGGAQNTIVNLFAPKPTGAVVEGLGNSGPIAVTAGTLTAPSTPGTYYLRVRDVAASVIVFGETGTPFWRAEAANLGLVTDLRVDVVVCSVSNYCVAKVNSLGCTPTSSATGSPSVTGPDDFVVQAANVRSNSRGLLAFSFAPAQIPFLGGTLCVAPPGLRAARANSGGTPGAFDCSGVLSFDVRHAWMQNVGLSVGATGYVQWIYRDPRHPDGTGIGLSDGLSFRVCP